ncbi:MAG TPA: DUF998 domain-containing protein [Aldersonia sp.]
MSAETRRDTVTAALLLCGIAYGVAYVVVNDVVAAAMYPGYDPLDQAVSELSATGAPPQTFLRWMLFVFTPLLTAFGVGVWRAAGPRRALRGVGATLVAFAVMGVLWLPAPMSAREDIAAGQETGNDLAHLVLAGGTVVLIVLMIGLGAAAVAGWFRIYSIVTLAIVLAAGAMTSMLSTRLPSGEPTPLLGFYERADIGAWLLWMAVLAVVLVREPAVEREPVPAP